MTTNLTDPNAQREIGEELDLAKVIELADAYVERMRFLTDDGTKVGIDLTKEYVGLIIDRKSLFQLFQANNACDKVFLVFGVESGADGNKQTAILMGLDANDELLLDEKNDILAFQRWRNTHSKNKTIAELKDAKQLIASHVLKLPAVPTPPQS